MMRRALELVIDLNSSGESKKLVARDGSLKGATAGGG